MELGRRRELTSVPAPDALSDDRAVSLEGAGASVLAMRSTATMAHARREDPAPTFKSIYEEHARFVWLTLQRVGVQSDDLGDVAHDVFVVVHRRLHTYDRTSRVTTWLFGICMRLAANYRRRRRRVPSEAVLRSRASDDAKAQIPVDEMLARRQESASAERVLAKLSLEKRAVFVMFEIESLACQEIAELMGIPIGTVYSRLHAARAQIQQIVSQTAGPEDLAGNVNNEPK
jgi:RNA polymerase sigma-70 factor (ECF subfamily)